jgi:hypothetical protein
MMASSTQLFGTLTEKRMSLLHLQQVGEPGTPHAGAGRRRRTSSRFEPRRGFRVSPGTPMFVGARRDAQP